MTATMTVEEAQAKLKEIVANLGPGDEMILTDGDKRVAKLVGEGPKPPRPGPGLCKGMITYMAPDFDAPLEDMKEYME